MNDEDRRDMQALVATGFGTLTSSEYLLLRIVSGADARSWLRDALPLVRVVSEIGDQWDDQLGFVPQDRRDEAWAIAFSYRGLQALGIEEDPAAPFPSEFRSGQADPQRRKLLRDDMAVQWQWGDAPLDASPEPVSMLVVRLYDGDQLGASPLLHRGVLAAGGLDVVRHVHGSSNSFHQDPANGRHYLREPFGFRDGIGQPRVEGLQRVRGGGQAADDAEIPLGEFVLGHRNAYGEVAHCPEAIEAPAARAAGPRHAFGRNGSYLAVQQIFQDVRAFTAFELRTTPAEAQANQVSVVEKMMGRRKSGEPLQTVPGPALGDNFRFRVQDPHGLQCPIGSHIRRANPRDSLVDPGDAHPQAEKLHRLLRRGRPYSAPTDGVNGEAEVGMFFIAIAADISRQFEFVKRAWLGNPRFGNLDGEDDPLLGRGAGRRFSIPGQPIGRKVHPLPDFTRTQGGGYFFMPGRSTLEGIARGDYTQQV